MKEFLWLLTILSFWIILFLIFLFIQDQEFVVIKVPSYFALAIRFHEVHTNHNLLNLFVYNVFEFCF